MFKTSDIVVHKLTGQHMIVLNTYGDYIFCKYCLTNGQYTTGAFHDSEFHPLPMETKEGV